MNEAPNAWYLRQSVWLTLKLVEIGTGDKLAAHLASFH